MGRGALGLAVWLAALSALAAPGAEKATGTLAGKVVVKTPDAKGALVPKDDASEVVVYVTGFTEEAPAETARMIQKDKRFLPAVLPVTVGQTVEFPNEDVRIHNVFSKSRARTFDLGKYRKGDRSKTVSFDKTGVVEVYCDIHEEMAASVLVLPNRAFAVTSKDGSFSVENIPPGKYTVFAWHRRGDPAKQKLEVKAGEKTEARFELEETRLGEKHLNKYGQPYRQRGDGY